MTNLTALLSEVYYILLFLHINVSLCLYLSLSLVQSNVWTPFIVFLTEAINTMKYEKCFIFKIL